ncbi:hypothetical protein Afil01_68850 [Actinorhabdospora filicis]|uniref:SnoaL-like domain-containing protein n=2 Tax=Actinorhabdospora filicis TaxID=1785913 RepID=A0A9W6SU33_9ACTN|nr:hypothetical protein Afil01_68850 [Actinorhabdospora filicis]
MGTAEVIDRFNAVFHEHDPAALDAVLHDDVVLDLIEGGSLEGREAAGSYWKKIAEADGTFEVEAVHIAGEFATIPWTYHFPGGHSRGVNLTHVRDGVVVRSTGYSREN